MSAPNVAPLRPLACACQSTAYIAGVRPNCSCPEACGAAFCLSGAWAAAAFGCCRNLGTALMWTVVPATSDWFCGRQAATHKFRMRRAALLIAGRGVGISRRCRLPSLRRVALWLLAQLPLASRTMRRVRHATQCWVDMCFILAQGGVILELAAARSRDGLLERQGLAKHLPCVVLGGCAGLDTAGRLVVTCGRRKPQMSHRMRCHVC